jgi:hypothetical protein
VDDPYEDREGGDRERRGQEHREGHEADPVAGDELVVRVQRRRDAEPEAEREGDGAPRHREQGAVATANRAQLELQAGDEHEEDQADVADRVQRWLHVGREQRVRRVAGEGPEERRSQRDAADDLAQDGGLVEPLEHEPGGLGDEDDHADVDQQPSDQYVIHLLPLKSCRRGHHLRRAPTRKSRRTARGHGRKTFARPAGRVR